IDSGSTKQRHVMELLGTATLEARALRALLGDHSTPDDHGQLPEGTSAAVLAACVHTDHYGTRSAAIVRVGADEGSLPEVAVADGHPCTAPFRDIGGLWRA
ncbi:MAG TPA: hypothetical protein VMU09_10840, partial [Acidimicrobiales bacterium]|nr:hypothetical protein [Acidimicrobiales bacterium]